MRKSRVLVIGCSNLGAKVASTASLEGHDVSIIDLNKESFIKLDNGYTGYSIEGDGTEVRVLEKGSIKDVDEVDIFTDNDNTNIYIANIIIELYPNVSKIIVRLSDAEKAFLVKSKTVKIISPINLSLNQYEKVRED